MKILNEQDAQNKVNDSANEMQNDLQSIAESIPSHVKNTNPANWVVTSSDKELVKFQTKRIKYGFVPDVKGMSAKDAVFILEDIGLNVKILGKGKVVKQSITPGTKLIFGSQIIIELKS